MTGAQIFSQIRSLLHLPDTTADNAKVAFWVNAAQRRMFKDDWPELITINATFTTDGSNDYDLSSVSYVGTTFGRIVADSLKTTSVRLSPFAKKAVDTVDPNRSYGGKASHYRPNKRTSLSIWPNGSSGEVITFDWVRIPADIDKTTAEADISFDIDRHDLLVDGGLWRGMRDSAKPDWQSQRTVWEKELTLQFAKSEPQRRGSITIRPVSF